MKPVNESEEILFKDVKIGEVFKYGKDVLIRTDQNDLCVHLNKGVAVEIGEFTLVKLLPNGTKLEITNNPE